MKIFKYLHRENGMSLSLEIFMVISLHNFENFQFFKFSNIIEKNQL